MWRSSTTSTSSTTRPRLADWVEATPARRIIATAHEGGALAPALNTLWSSGRLQRVDVPRLTSTGVERMATALLGGAVTRGLTEYLFAASNGLPLYVRELLADGTNDGTVIRSGGAWVWWGDATHVGPRVRDLVRGRIGMVSDDERVALELVAVSGGAPLRILRQVVSDDALDSCERRGIVALTPDGDLRIFPPARERAIAASLSAARRSSLRERLGAAIAGDPAVPDRLVLRAGGWSLDDGVVPLPELTIAAAAAANRRGDYHAARRLAAAALGTDADSEARLALSHALRYSGSAAEALALVADASVADPEAPLRDEGDLAATIDLVIAHAEMMQYVLDDTDGALELLDASFAATGARMFEVQRLAQLGMAGRYAEFLPAAEEMLGDPKTTDLERSRLWTPFVIGLVFAGRCNEALRHAERAVAVAPEMLDRYPLAQSEATSALFFVRLLGGWSLHNMPPIGPVAVDGLVQVGLGLPLLRGGDAADALAEIEKGIAALAVDDPSGFMLFSLAAASAAAACAGMEHRAIELADQLEATPWRTSRLLEPEIERMLMWSRYLRGGASVVAKAGRALLERYEAEQLPGANLMLRHTMLRLGIRDVTPDESLLVACDGPFAEAVAELFRTQRLASDAGLLAASERFEAFGAKVLAAEAAAEAHRIARADGRPSAARVAALRVRALTGQGTPPVYPMLRDWSSSQQLTPREREVVALAEQQLTNREIAARLNASKRTIEGHLHRAYTKLGVANRRLLRDR